MCGAPQTRQQNRCWALEKVVCKAVSNSVSCGQEREVKVAWYARERDDFPWVVRLKTAVRPNIRGLDVLEMPMTPQQEKRVVPKVRCLNLQRSLPTCFHAGRCIRGKAMYHLHVGYLPQSPSGDRTLSIERRECRLSMFSPRMDRQVTTHTLNSGRLSRTPQHWTKNSSLDGVPTCAACPGQSQHVWFASPAWKHGFPDPMLRVCSCVFVGPCVVRVLDTLRSEVLRNSSHVWENSTCNVGRPAAPSYTRKATALSRISANPQRSRRAEVVKKKTLRAFRLHHWKSPGHSLTEDGRCRSHDLPDRHRLPLLSGWTEIQECPVAVLAKRFPAPRAPTEQVETRWNEVRRQGRGSLDQKERENRLRLLKPAASSTCTSCAWSSCVGPQDNNICQFHFSDEAVGSQNAAELLHEHGWRG